MGRPNSVRASKPADSLDQDPVWQAFLNAPVDPEPAPEAERLALADRSSQVFVDGPFVSRDIARRATAEPVRARRTR